MISSWPRRQTCCCRCTTAGFPLYVQNSQPEGNDNLVLVFPSTTKFTDRRHTKILGMLATNTFNGGHTRSAGCTRTISSWLRRRIICCRCIRLDTERRCTRFLGSPASSIFNFTAKYQDCANLVGEIVGCCQHPLIAGSGRDIFEGVTERLDFKDEIATGNFLYRGHLR